MKIAIHIALILCASLTMVLTFTSCSSVSQPGSAPVTQPAAKPTRPATVKVPADTEMEGGIVGTGNEQDCKDSDNPGCNDNVK